MSEQKVNVSVSGIGLCGALTILFVALKLTKVITWSWLWVLSPLWLPVGLYVLGVIVMLILLRLR